MRTAIRSLTKLLIGALIFAGVPLLAWGARDLSRFFADPARAAYVAMILLMQAIIVILLPGVGRDRGAGKRTVRRQRIAVALFQVLSFAILIAAPYCDRRGIAAIGAGEGLRIAGLALFAFGFGLMHWAEAALGRQFSVQVTIQEDHRLVTGGPFRHVRHPRYLGIILFNVGFSLVFRSVVALALSAAFLIVLLWRIRDEDALLEREFGKEWRCYARSTRRLIPFVF